MPTLLTDRLELRPLPSAAARALPGDREAAASELGLTLPPEWPQPDLLDVLPFQAAASPDAEQWGVWVIVERDPRTVVGDIGFFGPPGADARVEVGFSVIPSRRRRGYVTESGGVMIEWAIADPRVATVVARCEPGNTPSIRTLERLGFTRDEGGTALIHWHRSAP